ncbi:hypothetical protein NQ028_13700, partial [Corynebacterium phoceense]|nr:hypothetical protein [Corynebacterium phoceense]
MEAELATGNNGNQGKCLGTKPGALHAADDANTALPEEIFLKAVEETAAKRRQTNIAKAITQAKFRYP